MTISKLSYIYIVLALFCPIPSGAQAQSREPLSPVPLIRMMPKKTEQVPAFVDNSKLKYFPPVLYQIGGSCAQASNIGYMFTYEINRLLDRSADIAANRFAYLYSWNFINGGTDDGSLGIDGIQLALSNGIITENDFPTQSSPFPYRWASGYAKYLNGMKYRAKQFNSIEVRDASGIQQVKQFLYNRNETGKAGGLVTFSSRAENWRFDDYYSGPSATGYKSLLTTLATSGAHEMTIVGYDDLVEFKTSSGEISKGAFIVVNSWGTISHDNGRFYLPYWFFLQKRNNSDLSYDVTSVDVEYREPSIVFKVGVTCDSRNDLSFMIGVSGKSSDVAPLHNYQVAIANNQGGDYPMQGSNQSNDIEFGFDFSDAKQRVEEMAEPNYFLTVAKNARGEKAASVANLTEFSVYDYRDNATNPKVYNYSFEDAASKGLIRLKDGNNIFSLPTIPIKTTSYCPITWIASSGQPTTSPLIFRTHDGKYVKVRFDNYDRSAGTINMKYVYNSEGGRKLK